MSDGCSGPSDIVWPSGVVEPVYQGLAHAKVDPQVSERLLRRRSLFLCNALRHGRAAEQEYRHDEYDDEA